MKYALFFLIIASALFACNATKHSSELSDMNNPLNNAVWQLIEVDNQPITTTYERKPYLQFSDSSRVAGFLGCNIMGGKYNLSAPSNISFENTWSTKMACEALDLENKFGVALEQVRHYKINSDTLFLQNDQLITVATFLSRADIDQVK